MTHFQSIATAVVALAAGFACSTAAAQVKSANASWGYADAYYINNSTAHGYIQDKDINGNCVKLKQGVYDQVQGTRTCTGQTIYWYSSLPLGWNGGIYLYEENTNRSTPLR